MINKFASVNNSEMPLSASLFEVMKSVVDHELIGNYCARRLMLATLNQFFAAKSSCQQPVSHVKNPDFNAQ